VDEGLKSLDARNAAVHGARAPVPGDRYAGGTGGDVGYLLQRGAFALLGPGPAAVRALSVALGWLAVVLVLALAPPGGRVAAAVLVALDPLFLAVSRTGLLEVPWTALALLAVAVAGRSAARGAAAGALLGAALLVKPTALVAAPAVAAAALAAPGRLRGGVAGLAAAGAGLAAVAGLALGLSRETGEAAPLVAGSAWRATAHLAAAPGAALAALRALLLGNPLLYVAGVAGFVVALCGRRARAAAGGPAEEPGPTEDDAPAGRPGRAGGRVPRAAGRRDPVAERRAAAVGLAWLAGGLGGLALYGQVPPPPRLLASLAPALGLGAGLAAARLGPRAGGAPGLAALGAAALAWAAWCGAPGPGAPRTLAAARAGLARLAGEAPRPLVTGLWAPTLALGGDLPVLVTCEGCRFPVPHGADANTAVALGWLRSGGRLLVVADEAAGEAGGWARRLAAEGIPAPVAARFEVAGARLAVLAPPPPR
jgi:hypothetical protein